MPFHKGLHLLERCLAALDRRPEGSELIIAADGALEDCHEIAARYRARVIDIDGPLGPARARNIAAASATGDALVFVDTDVVVCPGALARIAEIFAERPEIAAVFGAYDEHPADSGFVSQYKNLAHSFIHQSSSTIAQTFWAGFGTARRDAFIAVGGFDERFGRPSVEDIDLGYRLTESGYQVMLDPSLRACHLKRWTLWSMISSDVLDRGIPWTQLLLRYGRRDNDLNLHRSYRVCVVLAYLALLSVGLAFVDVRFLINVPPLMIAVVLLGRRYYAFFFRKRGAWFVTRVFLLHFVYHLYNGLSFSFGVGVFLAERWLGVQLPGALPLDSWNSSLAAQSLSPVAAGVKVPTGAMATRGMV